MSNYTLHHGDCLPFMKAMDAEQIDLTVTSPPYDDLRTYGGNYSFDFEGIARELFRITKAGGVVVWVVADATKNGSETLTSFKQALYFRECGFNVETMIYEVAGTGAKGSNKFYWQGFEFMFVFSKGQPKTSNRIADKKNINFGATGHSRAKVDGTPKKEQAHFVKEFGIRTNIWRYAVGFANKDKSFGHPAPFPEALARDHIISWSNAGDTVFDCFMGSGTTGKVAIELQRNFIGCEINPVKPDDPDYFGISERRIAEAQAARQPTLL